MVDSTSLFNQFQLLMYLASDFLSSRHHRLPYNTAGGAAMSLISGIHPLSSRFTPGTSTQHLPACAKRELSFAEDMFSSSAARSSTPILGLPNELLAEIAGYCTAYHPSSEHAVDIQGIVALSAVSRRMRANAMPFLFKTIIITSEHRLKALSQLPVHLLALVR